MCGLCRPPKLCSHHTFALRQRHYRTVQKRSEQVPPAIPGVQLSRHSGADAGGREHYGGSVGTCKNTLQMCAIRDMEELSDEGIKILFTVQRKDQVALAAFHVA